MNTLRCVAVGLAGWGLLGMVSQASGQADQPRERPGAEVRRPEGLLPPGAAEKLDLNDVQKAKLAQIQKEMQEKLQAAEQKYKEALEQARQNQDRQKAEEATQALRKEAAQIQEGLREQLGQLLTEEQRKRLGELQRERSVAGNLGIELLPRILGQLDLTAEQQKKIAQVTKEFQEKHEAVTKKLREGIEQARQNQDREKFRELAQALEKEVGQLREQVMAQVREVLNEEQKKKFAELQRRRPEGEPRFPGLGVGQVVPPPVQERLGLTAEQREKISQLQKDTEAKVREILTEDQNRKYEEFKRGGAPPERRPPQD